MKAIIIDQEQFDNDFKLTLAILDGLRQDKAFNPTGDTAEDTPLGRLHRYYHYEVVKLKERLERSKL